MDTVVAEHDLIIDTPTDLDDKFGRIRWVSGLPLSRHQQWRQGRFRQRHQEQHEHAGVYLAALDSEPAGSDGVLDFLDNCPLIVNTDQHDSDQPSPDGVGNACDNCRGD
jgi:hypothetical protein